MKKLFLIILFVASCSQQDNSLRQIYQPKTIILKGGTIIQTLDGNYCPQFDEIWHSTKTVQDLEKQLSNF